MADEEEDRVLLLRVHSGDEEEEETREEVYDTNDTTKASINLLPTPPTSSSKRKAPDFPYSVEDRSSSVKLNIPSHSPTHHVTRPALSKYHRYVRWIVGIVTSVVLCGLVAVAIALIATATTEQEPWYRKTVIYQCYPQSFQDSDGDGVGDLEGIRNRVYYFSDLGIKTVWLNPIFGSPQRDNGYDVSNYTSIDPRYGNIEQFKHLVSDLHDNDIHIILDFVPNHTSDEHPWFIESKSNLTNPKRHWYVWEDGSEWGGPPNNWISVFGNSSWTYDNITDQWYFHQFSSFQPDLNFTNPEVREAMEDVLRYWLDQGVDGFRVDAVKHLLEDPQLRNETEDPSFNSSSCINPPCYHSLIHNLTTNYPGVHEICQEWKTVIDEYSLSENSVKILVGEIYGDIDTVMTYYGRDGNEFTFPFNFFLLKNTEWTGTTVNCIVTQWLDKMPHGATANWVLGNHDHSRIASKAGVFLARALNTLLLTLPGTPVTYYGEELRMTDVNVPINKRKDLYQGRDPERTPMQWNTSNNSGFTYPEVVPWLPLATDFMEYNVVDESLNDTSMLTLYNTLLTQFHSSKEAFYKGTYKCLNATEDILVYVRSKPGEEDYKEYYIIAINFSEREVATGINIEFTNVELVLTSYLDERTFRLSSFNLRAGEAIMIRGYLSDTCNKVELISSGQCNSCT